MLHGPEIVTGRGGKYARKVWLFQNGEQPRRLCVFLDAEIYLERVGATTVLSDPRFDGHAFAFVSHLDGEARHLDYTCNESYSRYIARDVAPWFGDRLGVPASGCILCGLSLSGLASAYTSLLFPDVFEATLCQSGSFWWDAEWLSKQIPDLKPSPSRFWLSVGNQERGAGDVHPPTGLRQEVDQGDAVARMAEALTHSGRTTHFNRFQGGHEIEPWRNELSGAFAWLIR